MTLPLPPSSGHGGSNPLQQGPLQRDLEATAWAEVNKASLNIVKDSIEQVFTQTNPRYYAGYLGGFGYKSSPDQPLLDHPLESVRVPQSFVSLSDDSWQAAYNNLLNNLPPYLQQQLKNQGQLPFEKRDPNFVALNNVLETTAKAQTQLDAAAQTPATGSLEAAREIYNLMLPVAALKGSINNGAEITQMLQKFLEDQGANDRNFDSINNIKGQINQSLALLNKVNASLNQSTNGELTADAKALAGKAAAQLTATSQQLEHMLVGDDMQMLQPNLKAMSMVAMALSLPNTASAPLFIGLNIALSNINSDQSKTGFFDSHLTNSISNINLAVLAQSEAKTGAAGHIFLNLLVTTGLAMATTLASQSVASGIGLFPKHNAADANAARFFAFSAAMHLITNANIMHDYFKEAIVAAGGDSRAQAVGAPLLSQLAHMLMILAATQQDGKQSAGVLAEEHAHELQTGMLAAQQLETNTSGISTHTSVATTQLQAALASNDYEAFINMFSNLLNLDHFDASRQMLAHVASLANTKDGGQALTEVVHVI